VVVAGAQVTAVAAEEARAEGSKVTDTRSVGAARLASGKIVKGASAKITARDALEFGNMCFYAVFWLASGLDRYIEAVAPGIA
jgi:hypothetical protein